MNKVLKWLDNYWYHYKWETLIISFFAIFIVVATTQLLTRDKIDVYVLYTGPHVFLPSEIESMENTLEQTMSGDYNGDGEKGASFMDISLMTEQQILAAKEETDKTGDPLVINVNTMRETENQFNTQIFAGESSVCLLDPYWYDEVKESGGWRKLSDVLGYTPEFAADDYSVRLCDTEWGQFFTVLAGLPEDTVICMRTMSTAAAFKGKSSSEKAYACSEELLRDIFAFTFPEGYVPEDGANTDISASDDATTAETADAAA
ncbi:MAG: hypothetical protein WCQ72_03590 [Eubacteriales bacterium]